MSFLLLVIFGYGLPLLAILLILAWVWLIATILGS